jgi:hypothetical protein
MMGLILPSLESILFSSREEGSWALTVKEFSSYSVHFKFPRCQSSESCPSEDPTTLLRYCFQVLFSVEVEWSETPAADTSQLILT